MEAEPLLPSSDALSTPGISAESSMGRLGAKKPTNKTTEKNNRIAAYIQERMGKESEDKDGSRIRPTPSKTIHQISATLLDKLHRTQIHERTEAVIANIEQFSYLHHFEDLSEKTNKEIVDDSIYSYMLAEHALSDYGLFNQNTLDGPLHFLHHTLQDHSQDLSWLKDNDNEINALTDSIRSAEALTKSIEESPEKLKETLKRELTTSIAQGNTVLIPSGWRNSNDGQVIYFAVTPKRPEIDSSQRDSDFDQATLQPLFTVRVIDRDLPPLEYELGLDKLLDDSFLRAMHALQQPLNSDGTTADWKARDFYIGLLGLLLQKPLDPSLSPDNTIKNCAELAYANHYLLPSSDSGSWSTLMSVASPFFDSDNKTKNESAASFLQFRYRCEMKALLQYFEQNRERLSDNNVRTIVGKTLKTFAIRVTEALEYGGIDEKELKNVYATLWEMESILHDAESDYLHTQALQTIEFSNAHAIARLGSLGPLATSPIVNTNDAKVEAQHMQGLAWDFAIPIAPETIAKELKSFCEIAIKEFSPTNAQKIADSINRILTELPVPLVENDTWWTSIPPDHYQQIMGSISKLSELLLRATWLSMPSPSSSPIDNPISSLNMYKAIAIEHKLLFLGMQAGIMPGEVAQLQLLPRTPLFSQFHVHENPSSDSNFYSEEHCQQLLMINRYFSTVPGEALSFSSYLGADLSADRDWRHVDRLQNSEVAYASAYLKLHPQEQSLTPQNALKLGLIPELEAFRNSVLTLSRMTSTIEGDEHLDSELRNRLLQANKPLFRNQGDKVSFLDNIESSYPIIIGSRDCSTFLDKSSPLYGFIKYKHIPIGDFAKRPVEYIEALQKGLPADSQLASGDIEQLLELLCPAQENLIVGGFALPKSHPYTAIKAVAFFTEHMQLLQQNDFQLLCRQLIFENGVLSESLKDSPALAASLHNFVTQGKEYYAGKNSSASFSFFLHLTLLVEPYLHNDKEQKLQFNQSKAQEIRYRAKEWLKTKSHLNTEEKANLYRLILASYHAGSSCPEKALLTKDDISTIIHALFYLRTHPLPAEHQDPVVDRQVAEVIRRYGLQMGTWMQLQENAKERDNILNSILRTYPTHDDFESCRWDVTGFPLCISADGKYTVHVLEAIIYEKGMRSAKLPQAILMHPHYKEAFGSRSFTASFSPPGIYHFKDNNGIPCQIEIKGHSLIIQKQLFIKSGFARYYELKPKSLLTQLPSAVGSNFLMHSHTHWLEVMEKEVEGKEVTMLLLDGQDNVTHAIPLRGTQNNVQNVIRFPKVKGEPYLQLVHPFEENSAKEKSPFAFLYSLANAKDITIWRYSDVDGKFLCEIPHLQLQFLVQEGKATCLQMKNYVIDEERYIPSLLDFKGYVVLKDKQENKKVLVPKGLIEQQGPRKLSYIAADSISQGDRFFLYDVDANGELVSRHPTRHDEQHLFLAYLWLEKKNYDKAWQYVQRLSAKTETFTDREKEIIGWIQKESLLKSKDHQAAALQLKLRVILIQNERRFGKVNRPPEPHLSQQEAEEKSQNEMKRLWGHISKCLRNYRGNIKHVSKLKLTKVDLTLLLENILPIYPHEDFLQWLQELSPQSSILDSVTKVVSPFSSEKEKFLFTSDILDQAIAIEGSAGTSLPQELNKLRPKSLLTHFFDYVDLALQKPRNPHILLALQAAKGDAAMRPYCQFLETVYLHPNDFADNLAVSLKLGGLVREMLLLKAEKLFNESQATSAAVVALNIEKRFVGLIPQAPSLTHFQHRVTEAVVKPVEESLLDPNAVEQLFVNVPARDAPNKKDTEDFENAFRQDVNYSDEINSVNERIKEQGRVYLESIPKYSYLLKNIEDVKVSQGTLVDLKDILKGQKLSLSEKNLQDKINILQLANSIGKGDIRRGVREQGNIDRPFTLRELEICYLQQNYAEILRRNPALDYKSCKLLLNSVENYLIGATRLQQVSRALAKVDTLAEKLDENVDKKEVGSLCHGLYCELTAKRCFDPKQNPEFLLFEYDGDVLLREGQVEYIDKFVHPEQGKPNVVLEMMMGSGKSAVLLPLLALKIASSGKLSVLIIPKPLAPDVTSKVGMQTYQAFEQQAIPIDYSTISDFSLDTLREIYRDLQSIQHKKQYIVTTPDSIANLKLHYWLMLHRASLNNTPEMQERIGVMRQIQNLFKEEGVAIIDEIDTVLNCLQKVIFALGEAEAMQPQHRALIADIFEHLVTDPGIKKIVGNPLAGLTAEQYRDNVKELLISSYLEKIKKSSESSLEPLSAFITSLSTKEENDLKERYLANKPITKGLQDKIEKDPYIFNLLALMKWQFNSLLPLTLSKECDTHYGFANTLSQVLAVPYLANNTPSETSQFALAAELANATVQAYLLKKVSSEQLQYLIDKLRQEALDISIKNQIPLEQTAVYQSFERIFNIALDQCGEKEFSTLLETLNSNPSLLIAYLKEYVLDKVPLFPLQLALTTQDFPNIFSRSLGMTGTASWNYRSYASLFTTYLVEGIGGKTIIPLWRSSRDKVFEVSAKKLEDKVSVLLQSHGKAKKEGTLPCKAIIDVGSLFHGDSNEDVARACLKQLPMTVKAVCFFLGTGSQKQRKLAMRDGENVKIVSFSSDIVLPSERLTYYDQENCTGQDIDQASEAGAVLTIGKDTFFRDAAQGAWRMRGLIDKGQTIAIAFSGETGRALRHMLKLKENDPITLVDILRLIVLNEIRQEKRHTALSAQEKIHYVIKQKVDAVLTSKNKSTEVILIQYTAAKSCLLTSNADNPATTQGRIRQKKESAKVLNEQIRSEMASLHDMIDALKERLQKLSSQEGVSQKILLELGQLIEYWDSQRKEIERQMHAVVQECLPHMPVKMASDSGGQEARVTVQAQAKTQAKTQTRTQTRTETTILSPPIVGKTKYFSGWGWDALAEKGVPNYTIEEYLKAKFLPVRTAIMSKYEKHVPIMLSINDILTTNRVTYPDEMKPYIEELQKYGNIFGDELRLSFNFLPLQYTNIHGEVVTMPLFNQWQPNMNNRLVVRDKVTGGIKTVVITGAEVADLHKRLTSYDDDKTELLLYIHPIGVQQRSKSCGAETLKMIKSDKEFIKQMAIVDLLNGCLKFSDDKLKVLAEWLERHPQRGKVKDFVERIVLPFQARKQGHDAIFNLYRGSPLEQLLSGT